MTQAVLFTGIIPLALLVVFGLTLISGRLKGETRERVERAMVWVFFPAFVIFWGWQALEYARDQDWILAALMGVMAVVFAVQGVSAVKAGRLLPSANPPR